MLKSPQAVLGCISPKGKVKNAFQKFKKVLTDRKSVTIKIQWDKHKKDINEINELDNGLHETGTSKNNNNNKTDVESLR